MINYRRLANGRRLSLPARIRPAIFLQPPLHLLSLFFQSIYTLKAGELREKPLGAIWGRRHFLSALHFSLFFNSPSSAVALLL